MRTTYLLVILLVSVGLAGCIQNGSGADSMEPVPGDTTEPLATLSLIDCVHHIGVFPIDVADVNPLLPVGFEPLPIVATGPFAGSGLPGAPGAEATLQLLVQECTPAAGQDIPEERLRIAQVWIYVEPPAKYQSEGVDAYLAVPWTAVTLADVTTRFYAWGLPARDGKVTLGLDDALPGPLEVGHATATDGATTATFTSPLVNAIRDTAPEHIRLIGVQEREVTGIVDFIEESHTHNLIGVATLEVEGEDPAFPDPHHPGVSIHVEPGYAMQWVPVQA